jgi:biotin operon repressor
MELSDKQIIEVWKRQAESGEQNYAAAGRELGLHRNSIRIRILKLRAEGIDLPSPRPAGYSLTSERAKEIGRLRGKQND